MASRRRERAWLVGALVVVAVGSIYGTIVLASIDAAFWHQYPAWLLSAAIAVYIGADLWGSLYWLQQQRASRATYVTAVGLAFIMFAAFAYGDSIAWRHAVDASQYSDLLSAYEQTLLSSLVPAILFVALIVVTLYLHEKRLRGSTAWLTENSPLQNLLGLEAQLLLLQQIAIVPAILFVYGVKHLPLRAGASPGDVLTSWFGFAALVGAVFLFCLSVLVSWITQANARRDEYIEGDIKASRALAARIGSYCSIQAVVLGLVLAAGFAWTLLQMTGVLFK